MAVESVTDSVDKAVAAEEDLADMRVTSPSVNDKLPNSHDARIGEACSGTQANAGKTCHRMDPPAPPFPEVLRESGSLESIAASESARAQRARDDIARKARSLEVLVYACALVSFATFAFIPAVSLVFGALAFAADIRLTRIDAKKPHAAADRVSGIGIFLAIMAALVIVF